MTKNEYAAYLETPHWHKTRKAALERAEHRCQICNTMAGELHVHHRTYVRCPGHERSADLTVLCETCHDRFHDRLSRPDDPYIEIAVEAVDAETITFLRTNPKFAALWIHDLPNRAHWTMEQWDLGLAAHVVRHSRLGELKTGVYEADGGIMPINDEILTSIIVAHRLAWNPGDPKAERVDYLQRTVTLARR
jgi:hypothetical protein